MKCWLIRNQKFLKQVLTSFLSVADDGFPLTRLPAEWEGWIANQGELSPIRHLMTPSYDPNTGRWTKKPGGKSIDDMYYACMFCEASYYLWLTQDTGSETTIRSGSLAFVKKRKSKNRRR